jgi:hypothetical protein
MILPWTIAAHAEYLKQGMAFFCPVVDRRRSETLRSGVSREARQVISERDATDFAIPDFVESQQNLPVLGICLHTKYQRSPRRFACAGYSSLVKQAQKHDEDDTVPARHMVRIDETVLSGASRADLKWK